MQIDYPYNLKNTGRTADSGYEDHIRDLIEQVLFTSPGERVNRITFGAGLLKLIFEPLSESIESSTFTFVQGALQQWLGDLIIIEGVEITKEESKLGVVVKYTIRKTQQSKTDKFEKKI